MYNDIYLCMEIHLRRTHKMESNLCTIHSQYIHLVPVETPTISSIQYLNHTQTNVKIVNELKV